MFYLKHDSLSI